MELLGCRTKREAVETLNTFQLNGHIEQNTKRKKEVKFPANMQVCKQIHRNYLEKRRFDPDSTIHKWELYGTDHLSNLPNRIVIPVKFDGNTVSWTARSILPDTESRYISCGHEVIPHKEIVYGWDKTGKDVIIVEGVTSVWRLGDGAVATFGTGFTLEQLKLLRTKRNKFILFDSETQAQKKAEEMAKQLSGFDGTVEVVTLDSVNDPADLSDEEAKKIKKELLRKE